MSINELAIPFVGPGEVVAAATVIPIVGILAVGIRFWLRFSHQQKSKTGADDYTILLAMLFVLGMGVCLIYGDNNYRMFAVNAKHSRSGVAKKSVAYPTPEAPNPSPETVLTEITPAQSLVELLDWIMWLLMIPANGLIKLSAIFFYRRIFVVHKGLTFDIVTKLSLVVCTTWTVAFFFATMFGCGRNFTYPWRPLIDIASCNTNTRLDALMISDLITDILVWLLPIPVIWTLCMKTSRKLSVTGIMMLAAVSLAAAIVRLLVQLQISNGGYAAHTDINLTLTILLYWSMIESGLALIAACLPTLHCLFARCSVRSAISSIRSPMKLDWMRPHPLAGSCTFNARAPYSEITISTKDFKPTCRTEHEASENTLDTYKVQNVEDGLQIPLVPMTPDQTYVQRGRTNVIHPD